ncbi:16S rRNA (cytidine(1402)-2'-O)-methyltransferase [Marinilabiliaceae bacterium ANBcel2]|nr:16S rRNA (cytidine(1402)-2'-O)-methyltransferase [Marinilabiliaceae bacterium ANBcel2]
MSKLYIVPTPVGNLEDITLRALRVLKEADFILAEDTRNTGKLLKHYEIKTPMFAYHKFNEHKITEKICNRILNQEMGALVSDAGTPGISDPGYLIIRESIKSGIKIECLPGATALIPAIVTAGLPNDRFTFEGFLPHKKGRVKKLSSLAQEERTMIFYESPYRLIKTIQQCINFMGEERRAVVCREISKIHEEIKRGTLKELLECYLHNRPKGEIVLVIEGTNKIK